jgi:hypothetical protein
MGILGLGGLVWVDMTNRAYIRTEDENKATRQSKEEKL